MYAAFCSYKENRSYKYKPSSRTKKKKNQSKATNPALFPLPTAPRSYVISQGGEFRFAYITEVVDLLYLPLRNSTLTMHLSYVDSLSQSIVGKMKDTIIQTIEATDKHNHTHNYLYLVPVPNREAKGQSWDITTRIVLLQQATICCHRPPTAFPSPLTPKRVQIMPSLHLQCAPTPGDHPPETLRPTKTVTYAWLKGQKSSVDKILLLVLFLLWRRWTKFLWYRFSLNSIKSLQDEHSETVTGSERPSAPSRIAPNYVSVLKQRNKWRQVSLVGTHQPLIDTDTSGEASYLTAWLLLIIMVLILLNNDGYQLMQYYKK